MQKKIDGIFYKDVGLIFLFLLLLSGVAKTVFDFRNFFSKSSRINVGPIAQIDTFFQQGKAEFLYSSKGSKKGYELKSTNGYTFSIINSAFEGIIDRAEFENHLKHHELEFVAYSDPVTLDKYLKSKEPIGINVLQFQVSDKTYIDIEKGNTKVRRRLLILIPVQILLIVLGSIWLINQVRIRRKK